MITQLLLTVDDNDAVSPSRISHVFELLNGQTLAPEDQAPFARVRENAFTLFDLGQIADIVARQSLAEITAPYRGMIKALWIASIVNNHLRAIVELIGFVHEIVDALEAHPERMRAIQLMHEVEATLRRPKLHLETKLLAATKNGTLFQQNL